jgi:hypothetical protein
MMAKKKASTVTELDVLAAFEKQESCPSCGAEWQEALDDKGKPVKGQGLVLIHGDDCVLKQGRS